MRLQPGRRLGHYEILSPLGAGGMGEVYRARDVSLGREVALKVLPEQLATDPSNLARLEREAKLLAALRHPNVAVIHGLERSEEGLLLVLDLIPGVTLAERLRSGPLSLPEARGVFVQIARALEAAHERGIIHRDLKPDNVKLDADGTVKVLDFGLGKAVVPENLSGKTATFGGADLSSGLLLGTPAYMSPEQARGRPLTSRTDIWSFGVCLFQAVTGLHPFDRRSLPDTLSAIVNEEPPWDRLVEPPGLEKLLRRCLRKDERDRLQHVGDARIELSEMPDEPARRGGSSRGSALRWAAAAGVLGLALGLWLAAPGEDRFEGETGASRHLVIDLPENFPLSLSTGGSLAASLDGSRLVYASREGEKRQLVLRSLDQLDVVPLPGTDGAVSAFFSPDGAALGFFTRGALKTVRLPGGSPVLVAEARTPRGAAWLGPDRILFAPSSTGGLVAATGRGGSVEPATHPSSESGGSHRWPVALPGGARALLTLRVEEGSYSIAFADLRRDDLRVIVEDGSYPRFVAPDRMLFARSGDIFVARLDPEAGTLLSEPTRVVAGVAHDPRTGAAFYDASADGALFFVPSVGGTEDDAAATAILVSRDGVASAISKPILGLQVPRFSPGGDAVLWTAESAGGQTDIFTLDLARGGLVRLTFEGNNGAALWSKDGSRIFFASDRDGGLLSIHTKSSDGSGEARRLTRAEHPQFPTSLSPDERHLAYVELHPETTLDVWLLDLETGETTPLVQSEYVDAGAAFSPDGSVIAYVSNDSGRNEVYLRRLSADRRVLVSAGGGTEPVWGGDGRNLYYRSGSSLVAAEVRLEPEPRVVSERVLFEAPYDGAEAFHANYDVDPRGERFVMVRRDDEPTAGEIHVLLNWPGRVSPAGGERP